MIYYYQVITEQGGDCLRFDSFSHMLRHWAETAPSHPALYYDARGKQELSFSALEEAVEKRAGELSADGGSCIGILADGSAGCVIEIFAAARAFDVSPDVDAVMSLSFMSLCVIPALKVNTRGLFDVGKFAFVPVDAGE